MESTADWLHRLFIGAPGARLRDEDRRKVAELDGLLPEIGRISARASRSRPFQLVDAAAGKGYVGLLAAKLIFEPAGRLAQVFVIEREEKRARQIREALPRLDSPIPIEVRAADVGDATVWPIRPDLIVALHACGPASDAIIDQAIASQARHLLLVPCCTGHAVAAHADAQRVAERLAIPSHAQVRLRFIQSFVDASRTLRLEAAGFQTEVVSFVAPTISPHNLVWRCRRVCEPGRMARAQRDATQLLTVL